MDKQAKTDHEIHTLLKERWSPLAFEPREMPDATLRSLLEAARWAPSCFNDQPWFFLVAQRQRPDEFEKMLSCLVEANQAWAKNASVLMITAVRTTFERNGKPNRFASHDLGLAVGGMLVQATSMGLIVHQMGGFDPQRSRELYSIPEGYDPQTAIALGYMGDPDQLSDKLRVREQEPRSRKPQQGFVFSGAWDSPAGF
jgi:nitroreductase